MMSTLSSWPRFLCCLFLCFSSALAVAQAKTHHHKWEISYQFKSPDCVRKLAVTINGQTPGPTIRATQGDTVVVTVTNSLLTENVAIHWHGIRQIGTPWADGTEGVTQCPILPGDTFTYRFVVDRPGTYMYHAHYGMQRSAGLNDMIAVAVPPGQAEPFACDHEHTVLLNDWWHKSTFEQAAGLASVPMVWVDRPLGTTVHAGQGGTVEVDDAVDSCLIANTYRERHGGARSAGHNGIIDVSALPVGPEVVQRPYDWKEHAVLLARYGVARSAEPNGMIDDALAVPRDLEGESSAYDRPDHAILLTRYGMALSVGRSGRNVMSVLEAAEEEGPFAHGEHAVHLTRYGTQRSAGLDGTMSMSVPSGAKAESFEYRGEHHVLHEDRWNRSTYEQTATGLASVPLVWFGQIPGPTIRAVQGPAADVTLKNSPLTEHVAIHWHVVREACTRTMQIGTPLADGTEGVMQCPVLPGDTFVVDRPGTYHAHNGVQHSVELNGMISVSVPARDTAVPFAYNREHTDVHLARYDMQRTAGLSSMTRTMVVVSLPEGVAAEAFVRDGEHAGLVNYWWHTQATAVVPLFFAGEPAQHLSSSGRACFNDSRIYDATRPGCSPPPAFAMAAGGRNHIVTILSDLNSALLFDRTVQLDTGSLLIALIIVVQVALDDQRKNGGKDAAVAMVLLILLLVIPALPNATMAARQFHGGGHDQAAAPGLMPQSKAAAGHSSCTSDPNTQDPHHCVHH